MWLLNHDKTAFETVVIRDTQCRWEKGSAKGLKKREEELRNDYP
jgi:hypothetical protein